MNCTCINPKRKLYTNSTCEKCGCEIAHQSPPGGIYKFRAECMSDAFSFLSNLWSGCLFRWARIEKDSQFPFVEVEMKILETDLTALREAMCAVADGHVMVETLNVAEAYTGERWYNRF